MENGQIFIDKVDASSIEVHELRRNISIIPQDPVLFVGSIRYNLDPFQQYSDDELWQALERTHMKKTVRRMMLHIVTAYARIEVKDFRLSQGCYYNLQVR